MSCQNRHRYIYSTYIEYCQQGVFLSVLFDKECFSSMMEVYRIGGLEHSIFIAFHTGLNGRGRYISLVPLKRKAGIVWESFIGMNSTAVRT